MRKLLVLVAILLAGASAAQENSKHIFLAVDNGGAKLWYVNQFEPGKSWVVPLEKAPRDMQLSPDRTRVLVSHFGGAAEFDVATGKKTGFEITGHKGIQSARRLKDGAFLLATAGGIMLCDQTGKTVKKIDLPKAGRPYIRLVRLTDKGTILYSAIKPYCIVEIDFDGKLISQTPLPAKGYKQVRLANGNYLASGGKNACMYELTRKGDVVRTYGLKEKHPDLDLWDCSGWDSLPNGHVVVTCWHGHGYKGKGPHLVEFTAENKAVWTWYEKEAKTITNVLVVR